MAKQLNEMTAEELKDLLDEKYEEFENLTKSIRKETNYDVPVLDFYGISDQEFVHGSKNVNGTMMDLLNLVHDDDDFKNISYAYFLISELQEQK